MSKWASNAADRLRVSFEARRDHERAVTMSAYMRNQFPFLGIGTGERRKLAGEALAGMPIPTQEDLAELASRLWEMPEREYQYAAVDTVIRYLRVCDGWFLAVLERLITAKSWWDTVDGLASNGAGGLVARYPELASAMDEWATSQNTWLARTAILHQLSYKQRTDVCRLFGYCRARAGDREFFIRKAIGWALREYSKTDGPAVRQFVADNGSEFAGLSRREALLWLEGGRRKRD